MTQYCKNMLYSHHFQNICQRPRETTVSECGQSKKKKYCNLYDAKWPDILFWKTDSWFGGRNTHGGGVTLFCASSFRSGMPSLLLQRKCMTGYPNISGMDMSRTGSEVGQIR